MVAQHWEALNQQLPPDVCECPRPHPANSPGWLQISRSQLPGSPGPQQPSHLLASQTGAFNRLGSLSCPPPPPSPQPRAGSTHNLLGVDLEELVDWYALAVPIELQPQDRLLLLLGARVVPGQLLETQAQQDVLARGKGRAGTPGRHLLPYLTWPSTTRRGLLDV